MAAMHIIDTNINVMDARGRIIGSGDRDIEVHEGALLVLSQGARGGYRRPGCGTTTVSVRDQFPAAALVAYRPDGRTGVAA